MTYIQLDLIRSIIYGNTLWFALASLALPFWAHSQSTVAAPPVVESAIRQIVLAGKLDDLRWPDFSDYKNILSDFYEPAAYGPAWIHDGAPAPKAMAMIEMFKNARKKGLEPEDYDASRWESRLSALHAAGTDIARMDVALTVCTMRFVSDLHIGRVNPQHF